MLLDLARRLEGTRFNMPWPTMKDAVRASAQELQGLNRGSVRAADFEAFWISALQRGGWVGRELQRGPAGRFSTVAI